MPRAWLDDLDGVTHEARFDITLDRVNVGRASSAEPTRDACYLVIRRNTIGRRHATLRYLDGQFSVEDHQSINGTYVNGDRVINNTPVDHGDLLTFDEFRFKLNVDTTPMRLPASAQGDDDDDDDDDEDRTEFLPREKR
ncbi:MAG: FHA domain-containing protein [Chromatiales bacterium]|nr:FHA domain-containing protein [Chromatiales bacterium]